MCIKSSVRIPPAYGFQQKMRKALLSLIFVSWDCLISSCYYRCRHGLFAIETKNITHLTKFSKLVRKTAHQMVLEFGAVRYS